MARQFRWFRLGAAALAAGALLSAAPASAQAGKPAAQAKKPTPVPTPIPTPVPPERVPSSLRKGAAPTGRIGRFENPIVSFSKITRVEEVDLDNDGVAEALVEGVGTVKSMPPDVLAVGFVSRSRLPFENPIAVVFQK